MGQLPVGKQVMATGFAAREVLVLATESGRSRIKRGFHECM